MYRKEIRASAVIDEAENTDSISLRYIDSFSVAVDVTDDSSPSGIVAKVQASNDDSNWVDISGASATLSATGNYLIEVDNCAYRWARVAITRSSGSVTASIIFNGSEREVRGS